VKILLHICCGVCAAGVAERLLREGHAVTGYFFNPNIYPEAEYERRLAVTREVASRLHFPLEAVPYSPDDWMREVVSLEDEPEGGRRCEVCFRLRLKGTYRHMMERRFDTFTSTLTVSPHKPAVVVNRLGLEIGGERFLARDFKKQDGFKRTMTLAREWALYRQDYCGCRYSLKRDETKQSRSSLSP
jgi:predicted adenine nucleotide alpha hydrolase (AANH) superfamily ATPase